MLLSDRGPSIESIDQLDLTKEIHCRILDIEQKEKTLKQPSQQEAVKHEPTKSQEGELKMK